MRNNLDEEAQLVRSLKTGDLEAFIQIIRKHQDFINIAAFNLAGDKQAAGELVILTYLDTWNRRRDIHPRQSMKVYFMNALHKVAKANPNIFELKPLHKDGPYGWLLEEKIKEEASDPCSVSGVPL